MTSIKRLWQMVNEPRIVSTLHAAAYLVLAVVGMYALVNPPNSIEGAVGEVAMRLLAGVLTAGGVLGVPTSLAGIWWLERTAVALVCLASAIYLLIIIGLQLQSPPGTNRFLQAGFVSVVLLLHIVRWHRVLERPYDPERITPQPTSAP